jgi:hypothetical protein
VICWQAPATGQPTLRGRRQLQPAIPLNWKNYANQFGPPLRARTIGKASGKSLKAMTRLSRMK